MDRTFNTPIEATEVMHELVRELNKLPYNVDLLKMYTNIKRMVNELSKLEVSARNSPPLSKHRTEYNKLREDILAAIKQLEQFMLIARLMA
jgi:hypothetical protein